MSDDVDRFSALAASTPDNVGGLSVVPGNVPDGVDHFSGLPEKMPGNVDRSPRLHEDQPCNVGGFFARRRNASDEWLCRVGALMNARNMGVGVWGGSAGFWLRTVLGPTSQYDFCQPKFERASRNFRDPRGLIFLKALALTLEYQKDMHAPISPKTAMEVPSRPESQTAESVQPAFQTSETVEAARRPKTDRVVKNGRPTTDLVLSAYLDTNDAVFPKILRLYVKSGSTVADITYGKGAFWRNVPAGLYDLRHTDIQDGVDCRELPYEDGKIDCVVLDPPYMHTPGGTAHTSTHSPFEAHYRNNLSGNQTARKYHEAVLDLYTGAGREAHRVLRDRGVFIVKCQDEVCANRQRFTHIELIQIYQEMGFIAEDLFVTVRSNRPGVSRMVRQVHARKNHSYFLVFWKYTGGNDRWEPPK